MKKIVFSFMMITIVSSTYSQSLQKDSLESHYLKVYRQGLKYNDAAIAINALNGYVAITNSLHFRDTLSMLYFTTGAYYSSLLLSQEVYNEAPANINALARVAESYQNLGDAKNAVNAYEKVVQLAKQPYFFYQLASVQYTLKRIGECEENLQHVIADTNSNHTAINFAMGDSRSQQVPATAAAYNFLGILKMEANNLAESKKYLEQAVRIYPDFLGAKQNLELCQSKMKPASTPGKKPASKAKG